MKVKGNIITAGKGKVLRRKGTEDIFGNELYLGYSYYINGVKLHAPHLDTPDEFEEIEDIETY